MEESININIRCIEINVLNTLAESDPEININIRCIEIKHYCYLWIFVDLDKH